ncbi:hypothetical protein [Limnoglobus roseus]|nr:hypothetical protein [Limnoglobus roseus]
MNDTASVSSHLQLHNLACWLNAFSNWLDELTFWAIHPETTAPVSDGWVDAHRAERDRHRRAIREHIDPVLLPAACGMSGFELAERVGVMIGDANRFITHMALTPGAWGTRFTDWPSVGDRQIVEDLWAAVKRLTEIHIAIESHLNAQRSSQVEPAEEHLIGVLGQLVKEKPAGDREAVPPAGRPPVPPDLQSDEREVASTYPFTASGITFLSPRQIKYGDLFAEGQQSAVLFLRGFIKAMGGRDGYRVLVTRVMTLAGGRGEDSHNARLTGARKLLKDVHFPRTIKQEKDKSDEKIQLMWEEVEATKTNPD